MTYYKRGGFYYRLINTVGLLGRRDAVCHVVTDLDAPDTIVVPLDSLTTREVATAEEWEAAEKRAAARVRKEEKWAQHHRDALAYGLTVEAKGGLRGDRTYSPVIVRVTATRYVSSDGSQWIRTGTKIGRMVGESRMLSSPGWTLTKASIDLIESACMGAKTYDLIAAGKGVAP